MARAVGFCLCCLFLLGLLSEVLAAGGPLQFSIVLEKEEFKSDDPIEVALKLENKGKAPVYINKRFYIAGEDSPKERRDVFLIVTSPSGKKLPCKFSYPTGYPKSDYFQILEPGQEAASERKLNLKGYFDFSETGPYKVVAVYENVFGKEIGLDTFRERLASAPVTLKIIDAGKK